MSDVDESTPKCKSMENATATATAQKDHNDNEDDHNGETTTRTLLTEEASLSSKYSSSFKVSNRNDIQNDHDDKDDCGEILSLTKVEEKGNNKNDLKQQVQEENESMDDSSSSSSPFVYISSSLSFPSSWKLERRVFAVLFTISSCIILTIRLILDTKPSAYVIHSVVVFFDMILIHLFTDCKWLSISGELVTVLAMIGFHYTKQTIFELLETTMIAVLCSFHLIQSRAKWIDQNEHLQQDVNSLRRNSTILVQNIQQLQNQYSLQQKENKSENGQHYEYSELDGDEEVEDRKSDLVHPRGAIAQHPNHDIEDGIIEEASHDRKNRVVSNNHFSSKDQIGDIDGMSLESAFTGIQALTSTPNHGNTKGHDFSSFRSTFFEHFLDGSAGVMYTSFIGLIIDELITMESKDY